jgi:hypothetical protein
MTRLREVERNERAAIAARERLAATLAEIQQRLAPDTLARNAWDTMREHGREMAEETLATARRRPFTTGAILSAILLFFARGLVWRVARRVWVKARAEKRPDDSASAGEANKEEYPA